MSIQSEITRLNSAKETLTTWLGEQNVPIETDANLTQVANTISTLSVEGGVSVNNVITIGLSSNTSYTANVAYYVTKVNLTKETFKSGDKLTLSNGEVKIGAGVSKVLISANAITKDSNKVWGIRIRKNDSYIAETFQLPAGTDFSSVFVAPIGVDVAENDVITMYLYINTNGDKKTLQAYSGHGTYLTVQAIA